MDLSPFGERTVDLLFRTAPGPGGNGAFCSAGWGDLRIVTEPGGGPKYGVKPLWTLAKARQSVARQAKVLISRRNNERKVARRWRAMLKMFREVDLIISPSNFLRDRYVAYGVSAAKIVVSVTLDPSQNPTGWSSVSRTA